MALYYNISSMCSCRSMVAGPSGGLHGWFGSRCCHLFRQPSVQSNEAPRELSVGNEQHLTEAPFTLKSHRRWEVLRHTLTCVDTCGRMCLYSKAWLPLYRWTCGSLLIDGEKPSLFIDHVFFNASEFLAFIWSSMCLMGIRGLVHCLRTPHQYILKLMNALVIPVSLVLPVGSGKSWNVKPGCYLTTIWTGYTTQIFTLSSLYCSFLSFVATATVFKTP